MGSRTLCKRAVVGVLAATELRPIVTSYQLCSATACQYPVHNDFDCRRAASLAKSFNWKSASSFDCHFFRNVRRLITNNCFHRSNRGRYGRSDWLLRLLMITGIFSLVSWIIGTGLFAAAWVRWDRQRRRQWSSPDASVSEP